MSFILENGPIVFIHFYSPGTSVPYNHTGHPTAFAPTTRICMDFYGLEWTLNEFLKRCVFKGTRQNKKTPEILSGARSMEQVNRIVFVDASISNTYREPDTFSSNYYSISSNCLYPLLRI